MKVLVASSETWARGTFLLLLVAVPLALNPWALDPYDIQTHLLRFLAAAVLLGYALAASGRGGLSIRLAPLSYPLAAAWLISVLAIITSRDPLTSLAELLHLGLLVILFHVLIARPGLVVPSAVFGSMAIAGAAVASYGLAQVCGLDLLGVRGYAASTPGNPAFFGEVLTLTLPAAAALLGSTSKLLRSAIAAVLLLLGLALGVTYARAAILGLLAGATVAGIMLLWWARGGRLALRPRPAGLVLAALVLLAILSPIIFPGFSRSAVSRCAVSVEAPAASLRAVVYQPTYKKDVLRFLSLALRLELWGATIPLIRDHSLLGVGPGGYVLAFTPEYQPIDPSWDPSRLEPYAHNEVLQYAAEAGILGGLIFLWLAGTVLWMLARVARRATGAEQQRLLLATTVGLIAIGISAMFAFPFHLPIQQLFALAYLAILTTLYHEVSSSPKSASVSAPLARLIAILLVIAVGLMGLGATVSGIYALRGWQAHDAGDWDRVRELGQRARRWDPQRARRSDIEQDLISKAYARVLAEVDRRVTAGPDDPRLHRWRGEVLMGLDQPARAAEAFRRAIELDPQNLDIHKDLSRALLPLGSYEDAIHHLETYITKLSPGSCDAEVLANLGAAHFLRGDRAAAERSWAEAARCSPKMAEYRVQFLRRVEGLKATR